MEETGPRIDYVRFARRMLCKRWKLMLPLLVLIAGPTTIWSMFLAPRMYEASATVFIDTTKDEPSFLRGLVSAEMSGLYLAILRSRSLAQSVVDSLPREAREELVRQRLGKDFLLNVQSTVRHLLRQDIVVYSPQELSVMELQDARMSFGFGKDGTVTITATAFSPRVATDLANTYTDVLLARSSSQARESARSAREMIEALIVQARNTQQEAEEAMKKFQGGGTDVKIPDQSRLGLAKLSDLESRLSEIQVSRDIAQARLNTLRGTSEASSTAGAPVDPAVLSLRERLAQLETKLAGLSERYTDAHPLMTGTRAEIEDVQDRLRASLKGQPIPRTPAAAILTPVERAALAKQMADLEVEVTSAQAREQGLRAQISRLKASLSALGAKEMEYAELTRSMETQRNLSSLLTDKLNVARMNEQSQIRSIRIIDQASQPKSPSSKKTMITMLLGLIGGLGASLGLGFLLESLYEVVETEEDVARITGYPVLGSVPRVGQIPGRDRKAPVNFLLDGPSFSLALEACRTVRTSVEFQNTDEPPRTLVITSAGGGEGKSTVLFNLGWAFWETGRRILMIDADLRRPSLHRAFPSPNEVGLVDLLRQELDWQEGCRPIKEGFEFIPSGVEPSNPGALLGSRHMRRLLEMARDHADLVLIDSPPVLAVSDNLALASQVDGILLVVRSGVTRRRNLVRAKAQLEKVRAHVVGVIVNGLSPRDTRRYYAAYTQYVMTDDAVAEPTRARLSRIMTRAVSTLTGKATPDAGRTTR